MDWARILAYVTALVDQELLAQAFTNCHSSAEVYRAEAIEKVFGPIGGLKPKTLASLAQQMRSNLAGLWRRPEPQKDKKTNRKLKDIQVEVERGYLVARRTVEAAMKKFPEDWALVQARAALLHDEVGFLAELSKSTTFSARRVPSRVTTRQPRPSRSILSARLSPQSRAPAVIAAAARPRASPSGLTAPPRGSKVAAM